MGDERRGFLRMAGGAAAALVTPGGIEAATPAAQERAADRALWITW